MEQFRSPGVRTYGCGCRGRGKRRRDGEEERAAFRPCFVICPREEGQESVRLMSGGNCAPSVEPARAASSRRDSREEGGGVSLELGG